MGLKQHNPGCSCCPAPCSGTIRVTVRSDPCALTLPGAAVEVRKAGVLVGTCTTDATGVCSVPITSTGAYAVAASKAGWAAGSGSVPSAICSTNNVTVQLPPPPGLIAVGGCDPFDPAGLFLSTPHGTVPLNYHGGPRFDSVQGTDVWEWFACQLSPVVAGTNACPVVAGSTGDVQAPIFYRMFATCTSFGFDFNYAGCLSGTTRYPLAGICPAAAGYDDYFNAAGNPRTGRPTECNAPSNTSKTCAPTSLAFQRFGTATSGCNRFYAAVFPPFGFNPTFTVTR